jgi:uncharacterized protein with HEPN domain
MQPKAKMLLFDMRQAADAIREFADNRSSADLAADKLFRSAVYYQFIIVGEALSQLRVLVSTTFDQISKATRIVGFRNQIIHGYAKIRDDITWEIIEKKLPILHHELTRLLAEP